MDKYLSKINKTKTCWIWTGETSKGYGRCVYQNKHTGAHRAVYEILVGDIPKGLELDHLCRNRTCVNPKHLEPVTHLENIRRANIHRKIATQCKNGHPRTEDNLVKKKYEGYGIVCRICKNARQAKYMRNFRLKKKLS